MRTSLFLLGLLVSSLSLAGPTAKFPSSPDRSLTPGALCEGNHTRYPERVPVCGRSVSNHQKQAVFTQYDTQLGYQVRSMPRGSFKIDHYIPLCMGGSNRNENLWPQHESIYKFTDPLEPLLCQKMAAGRVLQTKAIEMIQRAKANPTATAAVIEEAKRL
jgi:hypothetical protein